MNMDELLQAGKDLHAKIEELMRTQSATTGTGAQTPAPGLDSETIFRKPVGTWTQLEKDHVRGEISGVLRDMSR